MKNIGSIREYLPKAVLIAGVLALLGACQPSAPAAPAAPGGAPGGAPGAAPNAAPGGRRAAVVTVQAETVKYAPLIVSNSTAGTVVADVQSLVASQTAGTVRTLVRRAGDWVKAGDPVVMLDDSQLQLALTIAQSNLAAAKLTAGVQPDGTFSETSKSKLQLQAAQKTYESDLALSKIGGIAESDLETAHANLEAATIAVNQDPITVNTATLQVQQAQLNLNWATVRAPFAGQIVSVNVQPGEFVATNTTVFVLVSSAKDVNFGVPPADVAGLAHGAKITFTQDGKTNPISLIGVPSAPVNGLVPLQAALPPGFPGAYGTVGSVSYTQVMATGALVPIPAIETLENTTYVFVIKDGKAAQANITILADSGSYAAVTGVNDGDSVIVNPPPGLLTGAPVRVLNAPAPPAKPAANADGKPAAKPGATPGAAPKAGGQ